MGILEPFVRFGAFSLLLILLSTASGCGAGPSASCGVVYPLGVRPTSATADHNASPPGNQVQFVGSAAATPTSPGCPVPALAQLEWAAWGNPDPKDISISSAADATNGTAVCKGATDGAVTLTGLFSPEAVGTAPGSGTDTQTATVTLLCK